MTVRIASLAVMDLLLYNLFTEAVLQLFSFPQKNSAPFSSSQKDSPVFVWV